MSKKIITENVKLGDQVECLVTGHAGIVSQRVENLNGCIQFTVRAPMDKDGKMGEAYCMDAANLKIVKKNAVEHKKILTGGPECRPATSI